MNLDALTAKIKATADRNAELQEKIKKAEERMAEIAVMRKQIANYAKTRQVYIDYRKNGYSKKLMQDYLNEYDINRKQLYLIYSIGLDESIKERVENVAKESGFENIKWMQAGAMISTHAGPGGFGIAGIEK